MLTRCEQRLHSPQIWVHEKNRNITRAHVGTTSLAISPECSKRSICRRFARVFSTKRSFYWSRLGPCNNNICLWVCKHGRISQAFVGCTMPSIRIHLNLHRFDYLSSSSQLIDLTVEAYSRSCMLAPGSVDFSPFLDLLTTATDYLRTGLARLL